MTGKNDDQCAAVLSSLTPDERIASQHSLSLYLSDRFYVQGFLGSEQW